MNGCVVNYRFFVETVIVLRIKVDEGRNAGLRHFDHSVHSFCLHYHKDDQKPKGYPTDAKTEFKRERGQERESSRKKERTFESGRSLNEIDVDELKSLLDLSVGDSFKRGRM